MKFLRIIGFNRGHAIAVKPFGGELRPPAVPPRKAIARFAFFEFVIYLLLIVAITMTLMNIGLSYIAQRKADATPYVADGSPFGCLVSEQRP
jgi:hypothetical protein